MKFTLWWGKTEQLTSGMEYLTSRPIERPPRFTWRQLLEIKGKKLKVQIRKAFGSCREWGRFMEYN